MQERQKRWETFSDHGCGYIWYGYDSFDNIAGFFCEESYIPEAFFRDVAENKTIDNFFRKLPEITTTCLPKNLRPELKQLAEKFSGENDFWKTGANRGLFIFDETDDKSWYKHYRIWNKLKYPYELLLMPDKSLKIVNLPDEIQQLLKPYYFENLNFRDCQFLDVSKYLYCEE